MVDNSGYALSAKPGLVLNQMLALPFRCNGKAWTFLRSCQLWKLAALSKLVRNSFTSLLNSPENVAIFTLLYLGVLAEDWSVVSSTFEKIAACSVHRSVNLSFCSLSSWKISSGVICTLSVGILLSDCSVTRSLDGFREGKIDSFNSFLFSVSERSRFGFGQVQTCSETAFERFFLCRVNSLK